MAASPRLPARLTGFALAAISLAGSAVTADAREPLIAFDIDAGRLDRALNQLAAQADVDIVIRAPGLAARHAPALRGKMSVREAVQRLAKGVGGIAVAMPGGGWAVTERASARPPVRSPTRTPRPSREAQPPAVDIVVIGSKHQIPAWSYPGSSTLIDGSATGGRFEGGSDAIARLAASVDSTHYGPGRNKLFIRGISDSAFLGSLQATVGQYLGDMRISYGVPDPDLQLVDIASIEILEGPQATLYGSGSLGGIVRIHPNLPDPARAAASVTTEGSITAHGAPGFASTAIANVPLADAAALRIVGYARSEGGYVDDLSRGRADVNRSRTAGMRGTLRAEHDGWIAALGVVGQRFTSADTAALPLGARGLQRPGTMMQPYESRFAMAGLSIERKWDDLQLVSATSIGRHALDQIFDSSGKGGSPVASVSQASVSRNFSSETRLSASRPGLSWVAGIALTVHSSDAVYEHQSSAEPPRVLRVSNRVVDSALFGEATLALVPSFKLTGGVRLSRTWLSGGAASGPPLVTGEAPRLTQTRLLPSFGLFWEADPSLGFYARTQQGFRPGGNAGLPADTERLPSDRIFLVEAGARARRGQRLDLDLSLSRVAWRNVQGDGLTLGGDVVSQTLGNAVIYSLGFKGSWRPDDRLRLGGSLFLNRNRLRGTGFSGIIGGDGRLPGVARVAATLAAGYRRRVSPTWDLRVDGRLRYFGRSQLGLGAVFGQSQGDYSDIEFEARVGNDRHALMVRVANPLDARGNRLAFSNPYRLFDPQFIPLRPAMISIGWEARF